MFSTREKLRNLIQQASVWLSVSCIAVGMVLSVAVRFMLLGKWLVLAGIVILGSGWCLSWVLPCLRQYRIIVCSYCGKPESLQVGSSRFTCSRCTRVVEIKRRKDGSRRAMLTLILPRRRLYPGLTGSKTPTLSVKGTHLLKPVLVSWDRNVPNYLLSGGSTESQDPDSFN